MSPDLRGLVRVAGKWRINGNSGQFDAPGPLIKMIETQGAEHRFVSQFVRDLIQAHN